MENIIIVGSSGHSKVVIDAVEKANKYKIFGLIDPYRKIGESTLGYNIIGKNIDLPKLLAEHKIYAIHVAIGDNNIRNDVVNNIKEIVPNIRFASIIHPNSTIGVDVKVGHGCLIMAGAILNSGCEVADFCLVNTNSSLDHDSSMGAYSSLAPSVAVGGNTTIGRNTAIGIGAIISHNIQIGSNSVVGGNSFVIDNIPDNVVCYGTPAKVVRFRNKNDKYL